MDIYNESTTVCNSICQEIAFMVDQSAYVYSTNDMHYSTGTYCILTERHTYILYIIYHLKHLCSSFPLQIIVWCLPHRTCRWAWWVTEDCQECSSHMNFHPWWSNTLRNRGQQYTVLTSLSPSQFLSSSYSLSSSLSIYIQYLLFWFAIVDHPSPPDSSLCIIFSPNHLLCVLFHYIQIK